MQIKHLALILLFGVASSTATQTANALPPDHPNPEVETVETTEIQPDVESAVNPGDNLTSSHQVYIEKDFSKNNQHQVNRILEKVSQILESNRLSVKKFDVAISTLNWLVRIHNRFPLQSASRNVELRQLKQHLNTAIEELKQAPLHPHNDFRVSQYRVKKDQCEPGVYKFMEDYLKNSRNFKVTGLKLGASICMGGALGLGFGSEISPLGKKGLVACPNVSLTMVGVGPEVSVFKLCGNLNSKNHCLNFDLEEEEFLNCLCVEREYTDENDSRASLFFSKSGVAGLHIYDIEWVFPFSFCKFPGRDYQYLRNKLQIQ
jgi:hypothetical protein